jgi:hypothetical protein
MLDINDRLKNIAVKKLERDFNVNANRILSLNLQPHDKSAGNDDKKSNNISGSSLSTENIRMDNSEYVNKGKLKLKIRKKILMNISYSGDR